MNKKVLNIPIFIFHNLFINLYNSNEFNNKYRFLKRKVKCKKKFFFYKIQKSTGIGTMRIMCGLP